MQKVRKNERGEWGFELDGAECWLKFYEGGQVSLAKGGLGRQLRQRQKQKDHELSRLAHTWEDRSKTQGEEKLIVTIKVRRQRYWNEKNRGEKRGEKGIAGLWLWSLMIHLHHYIIQKKIIIINSLSYKQFLSHKFSSCRFKKTPDLFGERKSVKV